MDDNLVVTLTVAELKTLLAESLEGKQEPENEGLMSRYEVLDYFDISAPTLTRWVKNGSIRKIKIGAKVFFQRSEITQR